MDNDQLESIVGARCDVSRRVAGILAGRGMPTEPTRVQLDFAIALWQSSGIDRASHRRSADQLLEQRRADRLLRLMDAHEDLRGAWGNDCDTGLREAFARRYLELTGVGVEQVNDTRLALRELPMGTTVEDIVSAFNGR